MKMRVKVLVLCMGLTLTALLIQTILFEKTSSNLIYEEAKSENLNRLQNMQNELYGFFKGIENNMIYIYNEEQLIYDLKNNNNLQEIRNVHYRLAKDLALDRFQTSDNIVALYIYDIQNEIVSSYRRAVTPKHNYPQDIFIDYEAYNVDAVLNYLNNEDNHVLVSGYYNEDRGTDIIRLGLKIFDKSNVREVIGYILCDIDSKALMKIMEKYRSTGEEYIWLQPEGDRPVFSMGEVAEKDGMQILDIMNLIKESQEIVSVSDITSNSVMFQVDQNKYNLSAYALTPIALLEENQKALTGSLLIIVFIMIIITVLVSLLWTNSLIKPLEKLSNTIMLIRTGKTNQRVDNLAKDEIGDLGREFNEMLDDIDHLMRIQYEDELLLHKAEYKALQSQINPHFLYNTLDTMSSISSVYNCDLVSDLSQSLSDIFRYSLNIGNPYATVIQEINHLKNYLFVMNVRMNHSVEYTFDVDASSLNNSLPRLSLQPVVENAINHGLKNKEGEKKIHISVTSMEACIRIQVEDNGVGMDSTNINELLKKDDREFVEAGDSIGLLNINARMKILYGSQYGLRVESQIGKGTIVYFDIPKEGVSEERQDEPNL